MTGWSELSLKQYRQEQEAANEWRAARMAEGLYVYNGDVTLYKTSGAPYALSPLFNTSPSVSQRYVYIPQWAAIITSVCSGGVLQGLRYTALRRGTRDAEWREALLALTATANRSAPIIRAWMEETLR